MTSDIRTAAIHAAEEAVTSNLRAKGLVFDDAKPVEDTWTDDDEAAWQHLQARRVNLVTQHRNHIRNMLVDVTVGLRIGSEERDELTDWLIANARQMTEALKPFV